MSQFETQEWGEEHKEEKWTSGLFEQSKEKSKKIRNRNRNKYPKGFAKPEGSSETKKANSSVPLKSPKSEILIKNSNDQNGTTTSKKKRRKGNTESIERDASEPPIKAQKKVDKVSGNDSLAHNEKEKKSKKRKINDKSSSVQSSDGEAAVKAVESNKIVKSDAVRMKKRNAARRAKRKLKRQSVAQEGDNELPAKVKKLTENSTVSEEISASPANESLSQVTPKKKKRNRKNKKNASPENAEDKKPLSKSPAQESTPVNAVKKPLSDSSAQESTPKLTSAQKRRARKKKKGEEKAEENPNLKGDKKTQKNQGAKETNEKSPDAMNKSKRKRKRKSVENAGEQSKQSTDSSSKQDDSLVNPEGNKSPTGSKSKKKHVVKEKNISGKQTTPSSLEATKSDDDQEEDGDSSENDDVDSSEENTNLSEEDTNEADNEGKKKKKGLSLREKMEEKLKGARFRFLNEQLYNSKSGDTNKYFLIEPQAFKAYHEGYKQQLNQWPVKPIDLIIRALKKKPVNLVIADFGCGDAQLSKALPNKVHSFDHVALNERVTVCDMAKTPLSKGSVDVVVFCLSLMGKNLSDYISEANRVLKMGGLLKIAEVESRFEDANKFIKLMGKFGFLCTCQDLSNDYFYLFDFRKEKNIKEGKILPSLELRACTYKKR